MQLLYWSKNERTYYIPPTQATLAPYEKMAQFCTGPSLTAISRVWATGTPYRSKCVRYIGFLEGFCNKIPLDGAQESLSK